MKDELVSFELAVLAKEIGFDVSNKEDYKFYVNGKLKRFSYLTVGYNEDVLAPTQALLQKCLREEFKIDVLSTMSKNSRTYGYRILCIEDGKTIEYVHIYEKHETYEEALEAGLMEGLKLIKS